MSGGEGRVPVAVLGATGLVGQHLVRLLEDHPWFRLSEVAASDDRVGRSYGDTVDWVLGTGLPGEAARMRLRSIDAPLEAPVVLSALPAAQALAVERSLAAEGRVVSSNASAHRMDEDVPLVVPEVNADAVPRAPRGRGGLLVTNPNCVVAGIAPVAAALDERWEIRSATVVTLQALSGAGMGGPSALRSLGNVVPYIPGEETKIQEELCRILGRQIPLAVSVNRVPVPDGHMAHVFLRLAEGPAPDRVGETLSAFVAPPWVVDLPSLPRRPLRTCSDPYRPQPLLDIGWERGMGVAVGRIRSVPGHEVALVLVVHNAVRGAAGACLANAELACAKGWVDMSWLDIGRKDGHGSSDLLAATVASPSLVRRSLGPSGSA